MNRVHGKIAESTNTTTGKDVIMNNINRRSFIKGLTGLFSLIGVSKATEKKEARPQTEKPQPKEKYNLIDDLVEVMNEFDKKYPDQDIEYFIHCNFTGLAFLNDAGSLEKEIYEPKKMATHVLWVPVGLEGYLRGEKVFLRPNMNVDIGLMAFHKKRIYNRLERTWTIVATRCFNVNRDIEGRLI